MIIGIEGQRLFRNKKHGMDMVALELIKNLQQIDRKNDYYIFVKPDEDRSVLQETANFKIIELKGGFYPLWEQIALPRAVKKYGCDVLHCTSNTAPLFTSVPLITIIHDIIYMENSYLQILKSSSSLYQKFGNVYRKFIIPSVLKRSQKVITVSHFEKKRIADFFKLKDSLKLDAIYNGVSIHFKPITDVAELQRIKLKYKLPDQFFFFLGNTDPKKNTKGVLKAYSDFLRQTNYRHKLVMLDYYKNELHKLLIEIEDPELINHIVLTGYVNNSDLPAIYTQCDVFLYPSLRESFGIPMLEAMSCNVAVITSNTSSMPEIAGDAAHIIDPHSPQEITQGLITLLSNEAYRNSLCEKGLKRSKNFSWKNMAQEYLELYKATILKTKIKK
jgi:glycosyltransferase involved in cell wall biosynthesis